MIYIIYHIYMSNEIILNNYSLEDDDMIKLIYDNLI